MFVQVAWHDYGCIQLELNGDAYGDGEAKLTPDPELEKASYSFSFIHLNAPFTQRTLRHMTPWITSLSITSSSRYCRFVISRTCDVGKRAPRRGFATAEAVLQEDVGNVVAGVRDRVHASTYTFGRAVVGLDSANVYANAGSLKGAEDTRVYPEPPIGMRLAAIVCASACNCACDCACGTVSICIETPHVAPTAACGAADPDPTAYATLTLPIALAPAAARRSGFGLGTDELELAFKSRSSVVVRIRAFCNRSTSSSSSRPRFLLGRSVLLQLGAISMLLALALVLGLVLVLMIVSRSPMCTHACENEAEAELEPLHSLPLVLALALTVEMSKLLLIPVTGTASADECSDPENIVAATAPIAAPDGCTGGNIAGNGVNKDTGFVGGDIAGGVNSSVIMTRAPAGADGGLKYAGRVPPAAPRVPAAAHAFALRELVLALLAIGVPGGDDGDSELEENDDGEFGFTSTASRGRRCSHTAILASSTAAHGHTASVNVAAAVVRMPDRKLAGRVDIGRTRSVSRSVAMIIDG